jgi:hypothetical protein
MIRAWSDALVRHRRGVLTSGIVVAVASVALAPAYPIVVFPAVGGIFGVGFILALTMAWRLNRHPPDTLIASAAERTLRTPDLGIGVAFMLVAVQMAVVFAGFGAEEAAAGRSWGIGVLGAAGFGLLLACTWRAAWRGNGITLRPDGLEARKGAGTLHVPWDALSAKAAEPGDVPGEIKLDYARPGLVRTAGLMPSRATVSFEGADRDAVLSAIRLYAREPGRRYAMGTAAEGGTLRAEVVGSPERNKPPAPPPTVGAIVFQVILALALLAGSVAFSNALGDSHHILTTIVGGLVTPIAGGAIVSAIRGMRARRRSSPDQVFS